MTRIRITVQCYGSVPPREGVGRETTRSPADTAGPYGDGVRPGRAGNETCQPVDAGRTRPTRGRLPPMDRRVGVRTCHACRVRSRSCRAVGTRPADVAPNVL